MPRAAANKPRLPACTEMLQNCYKMFDSDRKEVRFLKTRWIKLCLGFAAAVTAVPILGVILKIRWGYHDGDL